MEEIWPDEPNTKDWECAGLQCALRRGPSGHWCGYVGLPQSHPLFGLGCGDESPALVGFVERLKNSKMPENPSFSLLISCLSGEFKPSPDIAFEVHGGLTYARDGSFIFGNSNLWVFGFDCNHCDDYAPKSHGSDGIYRDIDYTTKETEKLARQLASLMQNEELCVI